jgi:hypothetical protein
MALWCCRGPGKSVVAQTGAAIGAPTREAMAANPVSVAQNFTPKAAAERAVETRRGGRDSWKKQTGDVRRFEEADPIVNWQVAFAGGTRKSARHPSAAAADAKDDKGSPRQRAGAAPGRRTWSKRPPATGQAASKVASRSPCGAAGSRQSKLRRCVHTRRADHDWSKRRAGLGAGGHRLRRDRCPGENCAGSKSRFARSVGSAAV